MVDLSTRMSGVRLNLHDREGNYQGVARVLKYEGHMLVYDPQTNGVGWVAMKGVPASLTEVEAWSAEDLGNFYPAPRTTREDPQATRPPSEEVTVGYGPPKAEMPKPTAGNVEANVDWDTDDVQDRSRTPSPSAGIGAIMLGESAENTPPTRQNIRLVTERVIEPGVQCRPRKMHLKQRISHQMMEMMPLLMNNSPNLSVRVISLTCTRVQKNCRAFYDILDNRDYSILKQM